MKEKLTHSYFNYCTKEIRERKNREAKFLYFYACIKVGNIKKAKLMYNNINIEKILIRKKI